MILEDGICGAVVLTDVFYYFVHPFFISESRLNKRNTSLYNAVQSNDTTDSIFDNNHTVYSTPLCKVQFEKKLNFHEELVLA